MFTPLYADATQGFEFGGDGAQSGLASTVDKLRRQYEALDVQSIVDGVVDKHIGTVERGIDRAYQSSANLNDLWTTFSIADFLVYVFAVLVVIFFACLTFVVRKKPKLMNLCILMMFIAPFLTISLFNYLISTIARGSQLQEVSFQRFEYSTNAILRGKITNTGLYDYRRCIINIQVLKQTDKAPKTWVNQFNPITRLRIDIEGLAVGESKDFKYTLHNIKKTTTIYHQAEHICS